MKLEELRYTHFWWACSLASCAEAGALHLRGLVFGDSCAVGENAVTAWRAFQGLPGTVRAWTWRSRPSFPDFFDQKETRCAQPVAWLETTSRCSHCLVVHVWRVHLEGGWCLAPANSQSIKNLICPFLSQSFNEFLRWDCTGTLQLLTLYQVDSTKICEI